MVRVMQNRVEQYGDWRKLSVLGTGGFGQVSLWENVSTREKIAIKMCKQQLQERHLQRWKNEVEFMRQIDHEGIVSFHEVPNAIQTGYVGQYVALGMEYCEEGDLRRMLGKPKNCCGLPEFQIRDFLSNIGSALYFLHSRNRPIVHRDLKPENIVMKKKDDRMQFKIIDLGYAKEITEHSIGTSFVGTLHYLAPEFSSTTDLHYTATVDFWSFGLVAFECITGRRPFFPYAETPMQFFPLLRERKRDTDICTVDDDSIGDANPRFQSSIPKPHALNDQFAKRIGDWLQQMLRMDPNRRGGGASNGTWYKELKEILKEKHILVYNTNSSTTIPITATESMTHFQMQNALSRKTDIPNEAQLLLFKTGDMPDVRVKAVEQCWKEPSFDNWKVFLYSSQNQEISESSPRFSLPAELQSTVTENQVRIHNRRFRRVLGLATNFVDTRIHQCLLSLLALQAISVSIKKRYKYFCTLFEELRKAHYKFLGILDFFERSLRKDMLKYEQLENDNILVDERLIDEWSSYDDKLKEYKAINIPATELLLASFNSLSSASTLPMQASDFSTTVFSQLQDKLDKTYKKYDDVKSRIRVASENDPRSVRRGTDEGAVADLQAVMRDLISEFVQPTVIDVNKFADEANQLTRKLVPIGEEIRKKVNEVIDAKKRVDDDTSALYQHQDRCQDNSWEMIRSIRIEALQMDSYLQIGVMQPLMSTYQGDEESYASIQLRREMDQSLHLFRELVDDVTNQSICDINELDWAHNRIRNGPQPAPVQPVESQLAELAIEENGS